MKTRCPIGNYQKRAFGTTMRNSCSLPSTYFFRVQSSPLSRWNRSVCVHSSHTCPIVYEYKPCPDNVRSGIFPKIFFRFAGDIRIVHLEMQIFYIQAEWPLTFPARRRRKHRVTEDGDRYGLLRARGRRIGLGATFPPGCLR